MHPNEAVHVCSMRKFVRDERLEVHGTPDKSPCPKDFLPCQLQTRRLLAEFTRIDICKDHYFPKKGEKDIRGECVNAATKLIREKAQGQNVTVVDFRDSNLALLFRDLEESVNAWIDEQDVNFLTTGAAWVWLGSIIRDMDNVLTSDERHFLMELGERRNVWKDLGRSIKLLLEGRRVVWFS